MSIIEEIKQMQQQGFSDAQISDQLKQQGMSPREVNESIEQSRIKSAVYNNSDASGTMEPSIMQPPTSMQQEQIMPQAMQTRTRQATQDINEPYLQEAMPNEMQASAGTEQYPAYQEFQQYPEYAYQQQAYDSASITEITEQIVEEKTEKIQKQIQELNAFKTEIQGKAINIEERLRRIELIIDRLQISILNKIGEYGQNISDLKQEMQTTQESFSKILSPLSENMKELRKISGEEPKKQNTEKSQKKSRTGKAKNEFEQYLRG